MPKAADPAVPVIETKPCSRIFTPVGNTVRGWVFDPADAERRLSLRIVLERRNEPPEVLATITADRPQQVESGEDRQPTRCGFEYRVPPQPDVARLRLFEAATDSELEGSPVHLGVAPRLEGFLDGIDENGCVVGWAWGTSAEYHSEIDILIDGRYAGTAAAVQPRGDLAEAGIGTGRHGFVWPLPDGLLDGREHEVGAVYHGTNRHLAQSPHRLVLSRRRYDGHASLGADGILRGSFVPRRGADDGGDRLPLQLLLDDEVLCPLIARSDPPRALPDGGTLRAYSFAVRVAPGDGHREISNPRTGERYPVEIIGGRSPALAPPQISAPEIARTASRPPPSARAVNTAQLLIPVWGEPYIGEFCALCLPSLLARGNLPAFVKTSELEVVILTREADQGLFEKAPAYQHLRRLAAVRFLAIDDIVSAYFDPAPRQTTALALTHAYFRGIAECGERATSTDFIFWNADFIAANGTFAALAESIGRGSRCTMAPSIRVHPDARDALVAHLGAKRDVLSIAPRQLVRIALANRHPTVAAKIVSRFAGHSIENIDRFYWEAGDDVLLCRSFLLFMLHIRPERVWDDINGFCDYAFIPEMVPDSDIQYEGSSDRMCIVELQDADRESEYLRDRPLAAKPAARSIGYWATEEQVRASRQLLVFDGREDAGDALAAGDIAGEAVKFDRFMAEMYAQLGSRRQWHNEHIYWRLSYIALGREAPHPNPARPRSRTATRARWTGYDLDLIKDGWNNPPVNLETEFDRYPEEAGPPGLRMARWLDDLFDTFVSAWFGDPLVNAVDENFVSLTAIRFYTQEHWIGYTPDFTGCRWGLAYQEDGVWYRKLGPGGTSIILHRTTQRSGFALAIVGRCLGATRVRDLAVTVNGAAPCGRSDQQAGPFCVVNLHVPHQQVIDCAGRLIIRLDDRRADSDRPAGGFAFTGYQIRPNHTAPGDIDELVSWRGLPDATDDAAMPGLPRWQTTMPRFDQLQRAAARAQPGCEPAIDMGERVLGIGWGAPFSYRGELYRWAQGHGDELTIVRVKPGTAYTVSVAASREASLYDLAVRCAIEANGEPLSAPAVEASASVLLFTGVVPRATVDAFAGWLVLRLVFAAPASTRGHGKLEYGEPAGGGIAVRRFALRPAAVEPQLPRPAAARAVLAAEPPMRWAASNPTAEFWKNFLAAPLFEWARSRLRRRACRMLELDCDYYESAVGHYGGRALASWIACQAEAGEDPAVASAWLRGVDEQIGRAWRGSDCGADAALRSTTADSLLGTGFGEWTRVAGRAARKLPRHPTAIFLRLGGDHCWAVELELDFPAAAVPRLDALQIAIDETPLAPIGAHGDGGTLRLTVAVPPAALQQSGGNVILRIEPAPDGHPCAGVGLVAARAIPDAAALEAAHEGQPRPDLKPFIATAWRHGIDPAPYLAAARRGSGRLLSALAECPHQLAAPGGFSRTLFAHYDRLVACDIALDSIWEGGGATIDLTDSFDGTGWGPVTGFGGRLARRIGPWGEARVFSATTATGTIAIVLEGCGLLAELDFAAVAIAVNGMALEREVEIVDDSVFRLHAEFGADLLGDSGGRIALRIAAGAAEPDALGFRSLEFRRMPASGDDLGETPSPMTTGDTVLAALAGLDFPAEGEGAERLPGLTRQEVILRRAGRDPALYDASLPRFGPALRLAFDSCPPVDAQPEAAAAWVDLVDRTLVEALDADSACAASGSCPVLGVAIGLGWGPLSTLAGQLVRTLSDAADAMFFLPPAPTARYVIEIAFGAGADPRTLLHLHATVNRREPTRQAVAVTQEGPTLRVWIDESVTEFALGWVAVRLFVEGTYWGHVGIMFRPSPIAVAGRSDIAVRRIEVQIEEAESAAGAAALEPPAAVAAALPSAIHCVVPVWGEEYVRTFLAAALPTHLAAGNLPALRGTSLIYEIYTDAEGRQAIENHPLYPALRGTVNEVAFFDIRQFRLAERTPFQLVLNYTIMNKAHHSAIARASAHGGALLFLNCDTVYSDGVFLRVAELLRQGYRTVENLSIRTDRDEMLAALAPLRAPNGVLSLSSSAMTRLALTRLHWIARGRFWEGPPGLTIPDNLYWWVADSAILARATHFMPLLVFPRTPDIRYSGTIDHGFVPAAGIAEGERWLMASAAEPSSYELSLSSHDQQFPHYERGSVRDLARFLSLQCEHQHMRNLERPVRVSAEPVSEQRWLEITEKSAAVLGQIRQRLKKYVLTAWRPDGATEAEECALVWRPPGEWRDPGPAALGMPDAVIPGADGGAVRRGEDRVAVAEAADADTLQPRAAE